jgi:hypothetical protein
VHHVHFSTSKTTEAVASHHGKTLSCVFIPEQCAHGRDEGMTLGAKGSVRCKERAPAKAESISAWLGLGAPTGASLAWWWAIEAGGDAPAAVSGLPFLSQ